MSLLHQDLEKERETKSIQPPMAVCGQSNDLPQSSTSIETNKPLPNSPLLTLSAEGIKQDALYPTISTNPVRNEPFERETFIYIIDLPLDMIDAELEHMIINHLERAHNIHLTKVKCYSNMGIAIAYVPDETCKKKLLNDIVSIVLNPRTSTIITFVEQIEFASYLVLDTKHAEKKTPLPTVDEIKRRWQQLCPISTEPSCNQLSTHFSNIYKLVFDSFDELIATSQIGAFTINSYFGKVFLRADCSFLEDLPKHASTATIGTAIHSQTFGQLSQTSIYVQYNKDVSNAVILMANPVRIWTNIPFIQLNNQAYIKKTHLAYRLVIQPVSKKVTITMDQITRHRLFHKSIIKHENKGGKLFVEVNDKSVYDECLTAGALLVGEHRVYVEPY